MKLIWLFGVSLATSLALVPLLCRWAQKSGLLDHPDERKVHRMATPRLGGVAIGLSFVFSLFLISPQDANFLVLLPGVGIVFLTGLMDDLLGITPRQKFAGQIVACLVTIWLPTL